MCGHAAPVMNGVLALDHLLRFTDIMVIHHTGELSEPQASGLATKQLFDQSLSDCGSLQFTDDQVRDTFRKGQPNDNSIDSADFGTIKK